MKILDIALKDLIRSSRSFFLIGMMFFAPLLLVGLIYFAFGGMKSGDVSMTPNVYSSFLVCRIAFRRGYAENQTIGVKTSRCSAFPVSFGTQLVLGTHLFQSLLITFGVTATGRVPARLGFAAPLPRTWRFPMGKG